MSPLELIATVLGVACVALTIVRSLWCWPVGLAMVACYLVVFWRARLYSDAGLQAVYVVLQVYGWWYWWRGGADETAEVPVRSQRVRELAPLAIATVIGAAALGAAMHRFTDADLPYWDALAAAMSLAAQWLMGRKVLESWLVWIAVDVLSIGIYQVKGLQPTAVLYALFLAMAIGGWIAWRRVLPRPAVAA